MFVLSVPWSVWELGQSFEATERERGLTGTSLPSFPAQLTMPLIRGPGSNREAGLGCWEGLVDWNRHHLFLLTLLWPLVLCVSARPIDVTIGPRVSSEG